MLIFQSVTSHINKKRSRGMIAVAQGQIVLPSMRVLGKRTLPSRSTISTLPPTKKMKPLAEPVLTLIVGPEEQIYFYHPRKMVTLSRCIRSKLMSSLMREEVDPFTQYLPDVSSQEWDDLMKYADTSEGSQSLTLEDAGRLRPLYAQLGFEGGVKLCDQRVALASITAEA